MFSMFANPCAKTAINRSVLRSKSLPMRGIKLHEYQASRLLQKYNIPIPLGNVAMSADDAYNAAKQFGPGHEEYVVKA